jgi:hypothetical protein
MNFQKDILSPINKIADDLLSTDETHFSKVAASFLNKFNIDCFEEIDINGLIAILENEISSIK